MILCFTKQQVKMISEKLESIGIENRRYYGDEKEDVDKDNVKVLVVTYSFAGKGFDFAQLSSLILATNLAGRKSLIQVIGRVLRKHDDKLAPVVDDLIDLAFPSMFIPDVKSKKQIVKNEFDCRIIDSKTGLDIIEGELK
jgi:superfamily II DNA or RNA helicase